MPFHSHENEEENDLGGGREKSLNEDTYLAAESPTGSLI